MKLSADSMCLGNGCSGRRVLSRSESGDLSRLAGMVGRLFRMPVAYAAMLGHRDRVMCRIGSGSAYWDGLKTLSPGPYLASPQVLHDVLRELPEGANTGELKFAATAPIDTLCGQHLGILVIADAAPHPEFSAQDLDTLVELAAVMADRIEMRMIASQAADAAMRCDEAEQRFAAIANGEQTLIACNDADGSCAFVNDRWLEFTGRCARSERGDGWQQSVHQGHLTAVLNLSLQGRQPFTVEMPLRRRDGVFRWMRGNGIPRVLKDGSFAGFTLCLTDVSDYIEEVS